MYIEVNGVRVTIPEDGALALRGDDGSLILTVKDGGEIEPGGPIPADRMWINAETLPRLCGRSDCPLAPRSVPKEWCGDYPAPCNCDDPVTHDNATDPSLG